MSVDEAMGSVPICRKGRKGLYADDLGVMVRSSASRTERFAWAEISHFADGGGQADAQGGGGYYWVLLIVLHTGREVPVDCTTTGERGPTPGTMAAIRQAAERYGIPADVAGIPMENGKPPAPDLYEDPGGQVGLRYWDGTQWSPLLPSDLRKPRSVTARKSVGSWSALPTAEGRWMYAATRAKYWTAWFASLGAVSVVLLSVGLLGELWWDRGAHPRHWNGSGWFIVGGLVALHALHPWRARRWSLKLDNAANVSGDTAMTGTAR